MGRQLRSVADDRADAVNTMLRGRKHLTVLSAMSPQQPDELLRALIVGSRHAGVSVRIYFGDLSGRLAFVDAAGQQDLRSGRLQLVAVAGGVPPALALLVDSIPFGLWDFDHQIAAGRILVDAFVVRVHDCDQAGTFALGQMVGYTPTALGAATMVCAEVTPQVPGVPPFAVDASCAHVAYRDPHHSPAATRAGHPPTALQAAIAEHVAALISDDSIVQFGLGSIPEAAVSALDQRRGLRVHSGILPASIGPMLEGPAFATGSRGIDLGHVATGVMSARPSGSDRWPSTVGLRPLTETHSPTVLAALPRLWAVNSAFEVDLRGRVNAEYMGGLRIASGGGQADFCRGAHLSEGGGAVIALPSRTSARAPRIVATLPTPSWSTSAPSDIDAVVTEHGVASLVGLTARERADALISVAHPDDRSALAAAFGLPTTSDEHAV